MLPKKASLLIITMAWLVIVIYYFGHQDRSLEVVVLDVGQGDSILIKAPAGQNILIDSGPDQSVMSQLAKYLPWWDRQLDLVIITHPHADHFTGLSYLLDSYQINKVLLTQAHEVTSDYQQLLDRLSAAGKMPQVISLQQDIDFNPCRLRIINPLSGQATSNVNNTSLVSRLSCGQLDWLFVGDAEKEAEEVILAKQWPVQSEFLKVGHHGSETASSLVWLQAVAPQLAIISVGKDNHYNLPDQDTVAKFQTQNIPVWRTDLQGNWQISSQDLVTWQAAEL